MTNPALTGKSRQTRRATLHQHATHTVGGVIVDGQAITEIVPVANGLAVGRRRRHPTTLTSLTPTRNPDTPVTIRFLAGNLRTTPDVFGKPIHIAANLTQNQKTAKHYYVARGAQPPDQASRLGHLKLIPGMTAEFFVRTSGPRCMQYLLKQLNDEIMRLLRAVR
jgi:HlyD family secretion protein